MNYREIEDRYISAMSEILKDRLEREAGAAADYRRRKSKLSEERINHIKSAGVLVRGEERELSSCKVRLLDIRANGTPQEVLEAERDYAKKKCEHRNSLLKIKEDKEACLWRIDRDRETAREEYTFAMNRIRVEAGERAAEARALFNQEAEAYREWKRRQRECGHEALGKVNECKETIYCDCEP